MTRLVDVILKFINEGVITKLTINGSAPNTAYYVTINKPNIYYKCLEASLCPNQGSLVWLKFRGVCLMKSLCREDRDLLSRVLDEKVQGEEKLNPEVRYKKFTKHFI